MTTKKETWHDENWLLLMQLYLRKPVGVKPMYSRQMVALALELHVHPQVLYEQMLKLRQLDTPRMERLWEQYGKNPKRLAKGVKMLREMKGFRNANAFYDGVETSLNEWEQDFLGELPTVKLIMILDQYFRLTPATMIAGTPEVRELARLIALPVDTVVEILEVYQICDPYLKRDVLMVSEFLKPCQQVWQRFGNDKPEKLAALAAQLRSYFS